jgi:Arc/MetJ family transcription regulator
MAELGSQALESLERSDLVQMLEALEVLRGADDPWSGVLRSRPGIRRRYNRGKLGSARSSLYTVRMKRTNLVLDEHLLEELTRVSGERTYSGAVTRAMEDYLRRHKAGRLLELAGSGLWEGDLSEMRRDSRPPERPRR